jgi:hypothetical protein
MEDRPRFEIIDGAVVHPLIAPRPGLSPTERAEAELAALWAYYRNGGGGMPWHYEGFASLEGYERSRSR